jgi:hypothetical protein
MIGAPGDIEPISNTLNQRPNPLVSPPGVDLDALDTVAVTHLHCDPLDDDARDRLPVDPLCPVSRQVSMASSRSSDRAQCAVLRSYRRLQWRRRLHATAPVISPTRWGS